MYILYVSCTVLDNVLRTAIVSKHELSSAVRFTVSGNLASQNPAANAPKRARSGLNRGVRWTICETWFYVVHSDCVFAFPVVNRLVITQAANRFLASDLIQEFPWEVRSSAAFRGSTTMRAVHCGQADSSPSEFPTVP